MSQELEHVERPAPVPEVKSAEREHANFLTALAKTTTNTEMVPKVLRGRWEAALAVMVYGEELGLRPMTALREVFIIEGTPSCSAKLMRALIYRAGHKLNFEEVSRERVVVVGERTSGGTGKARVTWELEDAKIAGLLAKDVWKKYPRSMLTARATSELARLIFPDVTIGYTPEELSRVDLSGDYDYVDIEDDSAPDTDEGPSKGTAILDYEDAVDAELVEEAHRIADEVDPVTGELRDTPVSS